MDTKERQRGRPHGGLDGARKRHLRTASEFSRGAGGGNYLRIANTLRVKSIGIAWDYAVPGWNSDRVLPSSQITPTMDDIRVLTSIARSHGLHVEYRVLFAVTGVNGQSERLKPADTKTWLNSLLDAETPALRLAQSEHVGEFIVGDWDAPTFVYLDGHTAPGHNPNDRP